MQTIDSHLDLLQVSEFKALVLQGTFYDQRTEYFLTFNALIERSPSTSLLLPTTLEVNPFTVPHLSSIEGSETIAYYVFRWIELVQLACLIVKAVQKRVKKWSKRQRLLYLDTYQDLKL